MRRLIPIACLALLALPSEAATLRGTEIHVASDMVTLADLFDGLPDAGKTEVAKAPPPGKTSMLDAGTLYALAVANHLDWTPRSMNDKVIVARDGDIVTGQTVGNNGFDPAAIIAPLTPALVAQGAGEKLAVLLDAGQQHLLNGITADTALAIDTIQFDPADKKFTATLVEAVSGKRYAVTGRAIAMLPVPVPAHRIAQGDMVTAGDLTTIDQRQDQMRSDTAQKAEVLVGHVAKRQLEANQPVQMRFLGLPTVIKRDDRVTMIVNNNGIVLTAEGRALTDAGMGETVQLVNAASNKTLEGVVTGPNTAEVRTAAAIMASAAPATVTTTR
jgi:flagella basal body P-ring formation protein FlgA